jgi:hypothetical protein
VANDDKKIRINFADTLKDFYGDEIKTPDQSKQPIGYIVSDNGKSIPQYPLTIMPLGRACTTALGGRYEGETLTPEQTQKRWRIGMKVAKYATPGHSGVVALRAEEVTELLVCTGKAYPPFIAGYIKATISPEDDDAALLVPEDPSRDAAGAA